MSHVAAKFFHNPIQTVSDAQLKNMTDEAWLKSFVSSYLTITDFTSIEAGRPLPREDIPKKSDTAEKFAQLSKYGRKPTAYALDFNGKQIILLVNRRTNHALKHHRDGCDYVGRIYGADGMKLPFVHGAGKTPFANYDSAD
jgi:hypothetical protein